MRLFHYVKEQIEMTKNEAELDRLAMKMIYIAHEYGGKQSNKDKVETIIKQLAIQYPDYCFVSPVHSFGYLYNDVSYDKGMEYCMTLLRCCDECWICSELSRGVLMEKDYCISHNIPVIDKR